MTATADPHRSPSRRRTVLLVAGAACLLGAAVPSVGSAAEEKGSGLGSFSLAANAPAVQLRVEDGNRCGGTAAGTAECEGAVPEAVSTLSNGPIGFGLASVAWPGTLAGNLGSLLIVSGGGQVPEDATVLNSPVRAEARTGQQPSTVTNEDTPPGTRMTASAVADEVTALAEVAQTAAIGVGTVGNSRSTSRTALTGVASAVAEARSQVSDVSLAEGVVRISSVTSQAKASTDGKAAEAQGRTVTTGMTIAGIPVEVGSDGVTVADQSSPLTKTLSETVNAALEQAGMTIALSQPTTEADGAGVRYRAGSLVFVWEPQEATRMTAVLGGAAVSVASAEALDFSTPDLPVVDTPDVSAPVSSGGGGFDVPPLEDVPLPLALDAGAAPVADADVPVAAPEDPVVAQVEPVGLSLPDGISPVTVVLGLLGAGLLAAGFRRLPDRLLAAGPSTGCVLEGAS